MKVFRSMIIEAPLNQVWDAVRKFDGVSSWNPGVAAATLENGAPTATGTIRKLDIVDQTVFRETLLAHSDSEHYYTYDILDCPLPVTCYVSTHRFLPVTHGNQTLSIWESEFQCDGGVETEMEEIVGDQIYINGMLGLNNFFKENSL